MLNALHCAHKQNIYHICLLHSGNNVTVTLSVGTAPDPDTVRGHIHPLVIIIALPLLDISRTGWCSVHTTDVTRYTWPIIKTPGAVTISVQKSAPSVAVDCSSVLVAAQIVSPASCRASGGGQCHWCAAIWWKSLVSLNHRIFILVPSNNSI